MKSTKKIEELEEMADSVMRWLSGEEVIAHLDWDERHYYLWFEPTSNFTDFCEEIDREDMLVGLENELAQIGVQQFCDLESVNAFCKRYCGDDEPAFFYVDELWNDVRGA